MRHNDALGAVDDELPAADHDRHLAEVDQVFVDLVLVLADQSDVNAKRHAVGQSQLPALVRGVACLTEFVPQILQLHVAVVALDGEDLLQQSLQPDALAIARAELGL